MFCTACQTEKAEGEFYSHVKGGPKVTPCKTCRKAYAKSYFERNKEKGLKQRYKWASANKDKTREYSRNSHRRLREDVIKAYGGSCACCGETRYEFLAIDHINGGGNKHRKTLGARCFYAWLRTSSYPEGFRVLCHNCNLSLGHYGYCPHGLKVVEPYEDGRFAEGIAPWGLSTISGAGAIQPNNSDKELA